MEYVNPINNIQDHIDSRDAEERIKYLEAQDGLDADERVELDGLYSLRKQYTDYFGEDSWEFGAQFERDGYFREFAEEYAEELGLINGALEWPNYCIDWERAARELKMDYTEFEYNGTAYQAREA